MSTMPLFVFDRRRDIEQEANFLLAGTLIVNIPKNKANKPRNRQQVSDIVTTLVDMARAGTLPNTMFGGWPEGKKPVNSKAIIDDDALLKAWSKDRLCIAVRVERGESGMLRIDSDALRQMGLAPDGSRIN
jgi:hypothetical protein